jgi:PAS domain S-box-containing protein
MTSDAIRLLKKLAGHAGAAIGAMLDARSLDQQEVRLRALFDSRPEGVVVITPDGLIQDSNTAGEALFGLPRDTLLGMRIDSLLAMGESNAIQRALGLARSEPTAFSDCRLRNRDGQASIPVRLRVLPIYGAAAVEPESYAFQLALTGGRANGNGISGSGSGESGTVAAEVEDAAPALPAGSAPDDASLILDQLADVRFSSASIDLSPMLSVGPTIEDWTGRSTSDFQQGEARWRDIVVEEDRTIVESRSVLAARGHPYQLRYRITDSQGDIRLILEVAIPRVDDAGCVERIDGIFVDLRFGDDPLTRALFSERVEAAQRALAGGVGRRLENISTAIVASVTQGRRLLGESGPGVAALKTVASVAEASRDLADSLSLIGGDFVPAEDAVDLHELIGGLLPVLHHKVARWHRFDFDLAPQLPLITGDRMLIERALRELLTNAIESRPERGRITIRTHVLDDAGEAPPFGAAPAASGRRVVVEIHDQGPGPRHLVGTRNQMAMTSTKSPGRGLGLAVARAAVGLQGGRLDYAGGTSRGAIATLVLPMEGPRKLSKGTRPPAPRVIIYERDPLVRDLLLQQCRRLGLVPSAAETAAEVLTLLQSLPGGWRALLMENDADANDDASPRRLASRTRELDPSVRIILLGAPAAQAGLDSDVLPLHLRKPFRFSELAALLDQAGILPVEGPTGEAGEE